MCSDEEHAARLAERRERKRAKRAIVDPVLSDDEETVPRTKGKKEKKTKIPAGLALLHGFQPNNVAKHRLTVCLE
jgi:hypothetical protein